MRIPTIVTVPMLIVMITRVPSIVVVVLLFISTPVAVRGRLSMATRRVLTVVMSHMFAVIHLSWLCSISKRMSLSFIISIIDVNWFEGFQLIGRKWLLLSERKVLLALLILYLVILRVSRIIEPGVLPDFNLLRLPLPNLGEVRIPSRPVHIFLCWLRPLNGLIIQRLMVSLIWNFFYSLYSDVTMQRRWYHFVIIRW